MGTPEQPLENAQPREAALQELSKTHSAEAPKKGHKCPTFDIMSITNSAVLGLNFSNALTHSSLLSALGSEADCTTPAHPAVIVVIFLLSIVTLPLILALKAPRGARVIAGFATVCRLPGGTLIAGLVFTLYAWLLGVALGVTTANTVWLAWDWAPPVLAQSAS